MYQMLPFDNSRELPNRTMVEYVHAKTFFKNSVSALDGVSNTPSPSEIVTQRRTNYENHCALVFGRYFQARKEHDNSFSSRTIGAIALRPTGAAQRGYYFFNLNSLILYSNYPKPLTRMCHAQRCDRASPPIRMR